MPPHVNMIRVTVPELSASVGRGLFAVLDACDEPLVQAKLSQLGAYSGCLYNGESSVRYQAIAPYLVQVDHDLLGWICGHLASRPWGIFLVSAAPLVELRRHLRRYLYVKLPDERTVYFRFYDPRVLPAFLQSCDASELEAFLGPIEAMVAQDEGDQSFHAFERKRL